MSDQTYEGFYDGSLQGYEMRNSISESGTEPAQWLKHPEDLTLETLRRAARAVGVTGFAKYNSGTKRELADLIRGKVTERQQTDLMERSVIRVCRRIMLGERREVSVSEFGR